MKYKAAILDFDGTLVDSMPVWKDVSVTYLKSHGVTPNDDLRDAIKEMSVAQSSEYLRETYNLPYTGPEIIDQITAQVEDQFRYEVQLKPHVKSFLHAMHLKGMRFSIATASHRDLIEPAIERLGIADYITSVVTCMEVGCGKESPTIFFEAMQQLSVEQTECLVIEDALHAVITAKKAGFTVVGVYDASAAEEQNRIRSTADFYVRSFDQLYEVVV